MLKSIHFNCKKTTQNKIFILFRVNKYFSTSVTGANIVGPFITSPIYLGMDPKFKSYFAMNLYYTDTISDSFT